MDYMGKDEQLKHLTNYTTKKVKPSGLCKVENVKVMELISEIEKMKVVELISKTRIIREPCTKYRESTRKISFCNVTVKPLVRFLNNFSDMKTFY